VNVHRDKDIKQNGRKSLETISDLACNINMNLKEWLTT